MIIDDSILSAFDEKFTLLEWLEEVKQAVTDSTLTDIKATQSSLTEFTLEFTFANGTVIKSPPISLPPGTPGKAATVAVSGTTTVSPDDPAEVINVGTEQNAYLLFRIPRGEQGEQGERGVTGATGATGARGATGEAASVGVIGTETEPPGAAAAVINEGDEHNALLRFYIPRGEQGEQGERGATGATGARGATGATGAKGADGAAATVTVGTTTTGAAGSSASVTNSGTSSAAVLNFTVPRGATGATGARGATGATGAKGADGAAATVTVGDTITTEPGTSASVWNSGTSSAAVLNFSIPKGETGGGGGGTQLYMHSLYFLPQGATDETHVGIVSATSNYGDINDPYSLFGMIDSDPYILNVCVYSGLIPALHSIHYVGKYVLEQEGVPYELANLNVCYLVQDFESFGSEATLGLRLVEVGRAENLTNYEVEPI